MRGTGGVQVWKAMSKEGGLYLLRSHLHHRVTTIPVGLGSFLVATVKVLYPGNPSVLDRSGWLVTLVLSRRVIWSDLLFFFFLGHNFFVKRITLYSEKSYKDSTQSSVYPAPSFPYC